MKFVFKRSVALILSLALSAALPAVLSSCRRDEQNAGEQVVLGEVPQKKLVSILEAFCESGLSFEENRPLTSRNIESFIGFLYDGELDDEGDGYASVRSSEAEERIREYFSFTATRRTPWDGSGQRVYYHGGRYRVRVNEQGSVEELKLTSGENGRVIAEARVAVGDVAAQLKLVFRMDGDSIRVMGCSRYDEK